MTTTPPVSSGSMSPLSGQRSPRNTHHVEGSNPKVFSTTEMDSFHSSAPSITETEHDSSKDSLARTTELSQKHSQDCFQSSSKEASDLPITTAPNLESDIRSSSATGTRSAKTSLASLKLDGKPNIVSFRDYISQGLALIREEKYEDAIEHFNDAQALKKIGYLLGRGQCIFSTKIPTSPKAIRELVDQYATKSICKSDQKTLSMARIAFVHSNQMYRALEPQDATEEDAIKQIRHEEALVQAEENMHALQDVLGHNITYVEPGNEDDYEIDIAATMAEENIPMTENFLKRYGRYKYVTL
jgi:hypothetical protein